MAEETSLDERLADLATGGRQAAVPLAAEQIRARGDRRRRRKRAARASGGVLLVAAVVVGGLSLVRPGQDRAPTAADPNPSASASLFVPPTPAQGEEYASELGYVYDAVALDGGRVRVTVQQLRDEKGTGVPTGVVHSLTLPAVTPVEVEHLSGGKPGDLRLEDVVDRLRAGPQWVFALDYDGEGRVQSLREAHWLSVE
ncbi:hypothetical protein CIB93_24530 [Streptomyces sp. WZ.A104]|uniref:hypothetical protein n=1 Tax=Streptomyces sp. WZ.A104 TaxID=2023771 RepID=UPI000BBC0862|nr:hypothetical protein [Streptomyces sp. WZ.A104]PCG83413.1 hypothetical protein CIB93_24530 [Streptomyces sp. WZ.A104]